MFRLLLSVLLAIPAMPALAANLGSNFCEAMKNGYINCGDEAETKDSAGGLKNRCPTTISIFTRSYTDALKSAAGSMKTEIQADYDLVDDMLINVAPQPGESNDQFTNRYKSDVQKVLQACHRLSALD
jgi:hypothetical protein